MITAAILVNERLTANIIWGTAVTLSGVFLVNLSNRHTNAPIATEPEQ
jgi:drug/metabolite transporter (DMT)-like permease